MSALEEFIGSARWFGGKGRDFHLSGVRRLAWLNLGAVGPETPRVRIELVTVQYDDGATELYQVPLAYYSEPQDRLEHALIATEEDPELGRVCVYDAMHDRFATVLWLEAFDDASRHEGLSMPSASVVFHRLPGHDLDLESHSTLFSGEQSNSSVLFGEDSLMKVFRKVTPGPNPDVEVHAALARAENEHVAALYGWMETADDEPIQLAIISQYLRTASDGWDLALASVRDLFAEADLHADEVGGDFASESHRLGVATAEVHTALAEQFGSRTISHAEVEALSEAMTRRLEDATTVVPDLDEHAASLRDVFGSLTRLTEPIAVQRVHGDLHLGQALRTVKGWKLVDFEGEPARPLAERIRPDSAMRDVAGMLRSLDYAAHSVESDVEEGAQIAYRATEWVQRNQRAFLDGYLEASGRAADSVFSADMLQLLWAYVADKAVYEAAYEARNRPSWISIPMSAIARITESPQVHAQEWSIP